MDKAENKTDIWQGCGLVFNIQRYTLHDGPGIRTEVFLKGCLLSCKWCSNPESQCPGREMGVYPGKCIGMGACGACVKSCPMSGAIKFHSDKRLAGIDRDECINCGRCERVCPGEAIRTWGKKMTVSQVMDEVIKDRQFYEQSGGGVTVSGGEPLMQSAFTARLLKACRDEGIGTCVESTFFAQWENIEPVIALCDFLITDIKTMDDKVHRANTGVSNVLILENLKRIAGYDIPLTVRIPLIPGVNDDDENIERTADFIINEMGNKGVTLQLLEFMHLGGEKCASLERVYPMEGFAVDRDSLHKTAQRHKKYLKRRGIKVSEEGRS